MVAVRLLVLFVTVLAVAAAPLVWGQTARTLSTATAHASTSPGGPPGALPILQDDNDNTDDNDNADENDNTEDNDNSDNNENTDDNDSTDDNDNTDNNDNTDENDNSDDNDNTDEEDGAADEAAPAPAPPAPSGGGDQPPAARCYDVGMDGAINLAFGGGEVVTLTVVPAASFPQASEVSLSMVDPATIAAPPGPVLSALVFNVQALNGCDGPELGQVPSPVNLGIAFTEPADKSTLQIARWNGSSWVDVQTVPDPNPNNLYISATIQETGTYTVYRKS